MKTSPSSASAVATLVDLHLEAERSARAVVLGAWNGAHREEVPSFRFYRNVIRLALFLRERAGLQAGDHVVSLVPLGVERLVLEWAALAQGAVSVAVDPATPAARLAETLRVLSPRVVLASDPNLLDATEPAGRSPGVEPVLVLEPNEARPQSRTWAEALELGGTLDTAERAQAFRSRARELDPAAAALAFRDGSAAADRSGWRTVSHATAVARVRDFSSQVRVAAGEVAYVLGPATAAEARIALLSFVGEGRALTWLGTRGEEAWQMAQVSPQVVLAAPTVLASLPSAHEADRTWPWRRWLRRGSAAARPEARIKAVLNLEGALVGPSGNVEPEVIRA